MMEEKIKNCLNVELSKKRYTNFQFEKLYGLFFEDKEILSSRIADDGGYIITENGNVFMLLSSEIHQWYKDINLKEGMKIYMELVFGDYGPPIFKHNIHAKLIEYDVSEFRFVTLPDRRNIFCINRDEFVELYLYGVISMNTTNKYNKYLKFGDNREMQFLSEVGYMSCYTIYLLKLVYVYVNHEEMKIHTQRFIEFMKSKRNDNLKIENINLDSYYIVRSKRINSIINDYKNGGIYSIKITKLSNEDVKEIVLKESIQLSELVIYYFTFKISFEEKSGNFYMVKPGYELIFEFICGLNETFKEKINIDYKVLQHVEN